MVSFVSCIYRFRGFIGLAFSWVSWFHGFFLVSWVSLFHAARGFKAFIVSWVSWFHNVTKLDN